MKWPAQESFNVAHARLWGYKLSGAPIRVVTLRVAAHGLVDKPLFRRIKRGLEKPPSEAHLGSWIVHLVTDQKSRKIPFYQRERLLANNRVYGPAVVVQETSTTILDPGDTLMVDDYGNLIIRWEEKR